MKNLIIIVTFLATAIGFSQTGTITGTVLDKEMNEEPLCMASIKVKETEKKVSTFTDGNYFLDLNPGVYTLEFSFIGYKTITIEKVVVKNGENTIINNVMEANTYASLDKARIVASRKKS